MKTKITAMALTALVVANSARAGGSQHDAPIDVVLTVRNASPSAAY